MSKYLELTSYLEKLAEDSWKASFKDVEKVLGFSLPASAYNHTAWWANQTAAGRPQADSWQNSGWQTSHVDLTRKLVVFSRARPRASSKAGAALPIGAPAVPTVAKAAAPAPAGLSLAQAKAGLAAFYNVAAEKIEITIRG